MHPQGRKHVHVQNLTYKTILSGTNCEKKMEHMLLLQNTHTHTGVTDVQHAILNQFTFQKGKWIQGDMLTDCKHKHTVRFHQERNPGMTVLHLTRPYLQSVCSSPEGTLRYSQWNYKAVLLQHGNEMEWENRKGKDGPKLMLSARVWLVVVFLRELLCI